MDDDLRSLGEDVLRDAADRADTFDAELARTLRDMAADYAGPELEGLRERPMQITQNAFKEPK